MLEKVLIIIMLENDIADLTYAYKEIHKAMDKLKDIDDFPNGQYYELNDIAEVINDLKISKEVELEILREE